MEKKKKEKKLIVKPRRLDFFMSISNCLGMFLEGNYELSVTQKI